MVFLDLVCTKCQESRYRSKIQVGPETKATPDMFIAIGDQPPPETFQESPLCYVCDSKLVPMPAPKVPASKPNREEMRAMREQKLLSKSYEEEAQLSVGFTPNITTIFECAPGEGNMTSTVLAPGKILIQTDKRLVVLTLE